jgi:hypothetical protein
MAAALRIAPELLTPTAGPERSVSPEPMEEVEEMAPEETRLAREVWKKYGDDFGRRLADLEAGRHPYQQPG